MRQLWPPAAHQPPSIRRQAFLPTAVPLEHSTKLHTQMHSLAALGSAYPCAGPDHEPVPCCYHCHRGCPSSSLPSSAFPPAKSLKSRTFRSYLRRRVEQLVPASREFHLLVQEVAYLGDAAQGCRCWVAGRQQRQCA